MCPLRPSHLTIYGALYALLIAGAHPSHAHAQSSARDQAAAAYDQGVRAIAAGDFNSAAESFETANRSVPSAQAVIQAIRAHRSADTLAHSARAATLAVGLLTSYPADSRVTGYAYRVIDELSPSLARVQVRCQGCDLSIDESAAPLSVFLTPGSHSVVASWGERVVRRELQVTAGQTLPLEFSPPVTAPIAPSPAVEASVAAAPIAVVTTPVPAPMTDAPPPRRGLSPAVFAVSLVATAGLGGALAWSALNTLQGRDEYVQNPTQAGLDDGRSRELRTNILLGATAAMGVTTILVAGFTRWRSAPARPMIAMAPSAGLLGVEGTF